MAVTVVATAGASNANSYIALADVDLYMEPKTAFNAIWDALSTPAIKNQWIVLAAQAIDRMRFLQSGRTKQGYTVTQSMHFPLSNQVLIPQVVKDAQCEMIVYLLNEADSTDGTIDDRGVLSAAIVGVLDVEFASDKVSADVSGSAGGTIQTVKDLLRDFLGGGRNNIPLLKY